MHTVSCCAPFGAASAEPCPAAVWVSAAVMAAHMCPHALLLLLPFPWRTQVCYALSQLAAGFQDGEGPSSPLSPYYKDIVQALLETVRGAAAGCSVPWPFPRAIWATGQPPCAHDSFRRPFGEPPLAVLGPAARARARLHHCCRCRFPCRLSGHATPRRRPACRPRRLRP